MGMGMGMGMDSGHNDSHMNMGSGHGADSGHACRSKHLPYTSPTSLSCPHLPHTDHVHSIPFHSLDVAQLQHR